jgi:hypothetical protein
LNPSRAASRRRRAWPGLLGLAAYCLLWGLVVEAVDRATGDPFAPLDVVTHALWVGAAILALPLFGRVWNTWRPGRRRIY